MDFSFTEEQKLLRQTIRGFAERVVAPRARQIDESYEFPWDIVREMGNLGYMGMTTPEAYGGVAMGHVARMIALEEIGRASAAVAVILQVQHLCMAPILDFGTEEQKQRFLPPLAHGERLAAIAVTEPSGGSDLAGLRTTARRGGESYVLNGGKCFISNSHIADLVAVIARTGEGAKGLTAFLIETGTPGLRPGREERKIGLRGLEMGEVIPEECRIPAGNRIGSEGDGIKIALKSIADTRRLGMAGAALGILNACLGTSIRFAKERLLYGKPMADLQAIQLLISDIYADLETSRLLCYRAAWMADQSIRDDGARALAKYYTTEAAIRCAKKAVDIHGAYGVIEDYPVQRLYRDALACISAAGTSQVMQLVMARKALS